MAGLTPGAKQYGAATKNRRQNKRGKNAQGRPSKGSQAWQDQETHSVYRHSIETFVRFGSWQGVEGGPRAVGSEQKGVPITAAKKQAPSNVVNLMDALRASIGDKGKTAGAAAKRTKPPAKKAAKSKKSA